MTPHLLSRDLFNKEKHLCRQKHRAKGRFCCSYQRFGVLARWRQERPKAGGIFFLYGVPPLWSSGVCQVEGWKIWAGTAEELGKDKNWGEEELESQWQVFVVLWIKSSGYFKTGLTFFGHAGLWRRVLNQWGGYAGAAVRLPSVLFLLQ